MKISVGRYLKRKTMSVWVKEYINKNFATCKGLCDLQELYTAFKEKQPNVNIEFSKFCTFRPKWCVLAGSKITHSVCVCSSRQNVLLLAGWDWDLTYKDLIKKTVCNPKSKKHMMNRCESCSGTAIPKKFLDQKLNELEYYEEFKWDTKDRTTLTNIAATSEEYKETLIGVIDDLTRNSYIAKLKITSSWYRTRLYPFTSYTSFLYQVQTNIADYLKANHPHIKK